MCGLVQVGNILHTALREHLLTFGYEPEPITSVLWLQNKNGITFILVVYKFGVLYHTREESQQLINEIQEKYEITQDWTGSLYSGITLNWHYKTDILYISVTGYVKEVLHKFYHSTTLLPRHYPHQWNPPNYDSTAPQMAHQAPELPKLSYP